MFHCLEKPKYYVICGEDFDELTILWQAFECENITLNTRKSLGSWLNEWSILILTVLEWINLLTNIGSSSLALQYNYNGNKVCSTESIKCNNIATFTALLFVSIDNFTTGFWLIENNKMFTHIISYIYIYQNQNIW